MSDSTGAGSTGLGKPSAARSSRPSDRGGDHFSAPLGSARSGRLFRWLDDRGSDGPSGRVYRELMATGAVISGPRTFELAGRWRGDHHDGVPIHVLTHHVDEGDEPPGSAKFYTDVVACATEARTAAGDRAVMVHGAGAARALLQVGQLDELEIHLVPVLLGAGRRLLETRDGNHIELQLIRCLEGRDATHLRYRVRR
jgi:dihydrofolate reductase